MARKIIAHKVSSRLDRKIKAQGFWWGYVLLRHLGRSCNNCVDMKRRSFGDPWKRCDDHDGGNV